MIRSSSGDVVRGVPSSSASWAPGGAASPYYYAADLYADTREEIEAILATPEGQAAVEDVPNYASGGVTFLYTEVDDVV